MYIFLANLENATIKATFAIIDGSTID
jgi:hypothetical protein